MLDTYQCPNTECWWDKTGKEEEICPECGSKLIKMGIREGSKILSAKGKFKQNPEQKQMIQKRKEEIKAAKKRKNKNNLY